ncbi:MAG: alpha/beta fold hydrolase, partial [Gemmobacter sp.]|nr:alpha/beta fold hydrolase [Gemmobacter sp.]
SVLNDLIPGTEKQIVWAGTAGARTPVSIVYLHGFSASSHEIRPVPEKVASAVGANLYYARLAGHGRNGAAMADAMADDWITDMAEALAIGARLGDRVIVMATSTGAALATAGLGTADLRMALPGADKVAGLIFVSPNYRLRSAAVSRALDLPLADSWLPVIAGFHRSYPAINAEHAKYWTTQYPTAAIFPMARLMRAARSADPTAITAPLLLIYSPDDQVVNPDTALAIASRWGGPVKIMAYRSGPGMDPEAHVIAGDIRSPGLTDPVADLMTKWIGAL